MVRSGLLGILTLLILTTTFLMTSAVEAKSARYTHFDADLVLLEDGSFRITETQVVTFEGGTFSKGHRDISTVRTDGITDVTVAESIDGKLVAYSQTTSEDLASGINQFALSSNQTMLSIRWSFESTSDQSRTFVISYLVSGALRVYPDEEPPNQQIWWTPVSSALTSETPVDASRVTITLPKAVPLSAVAASSDSEDVPEVLSTDGQVFTWEENEFSSGEELTVRLQFPVLLPDVVAPAWQAADDADRARQAESETRNSLIHLMMIGAGLLLLGGGVVGLFGVWYTRGRDPHTGLVADFIPQPPDDLSPGLAGTLVDEHANESDIVATLLDLARRGEISMTDLGLSGPEKRAFGHDYKLELLNTSREPAPHEKRMLTAIFGANYQAGASTTLNKAKGAVIASYPAFKDDLYAELVRIGYFNRSPEETRKRWGRRGFWITGIAIAAAVIGYFALDSFALIPAAALLLLSVVVRPLGKAMPQKSLAGAESAAKWKAFKRYLQEIDRYEKLDESRQIFDKYLAYAVAFGVETSWVNKFAQVNTPVPTWFDPGDVLIPHGHTTWHTGGGMSGGGGGGGGVDLPDIDMPGMPDIQKASGKAAAGLNSGSSGLMDLLKVAGAIIEIASSFSGGGDSGGSFGGGGGGFD